MIGGGHLRYYVDTQSVPIKKHKTNTSEGKLMRSVRKQAKVELIEWSHPVDKDYRGRPFFQEVDGRVVIKIQREGHQRDVSR